MKKENIFSVILFVLFVFLSETLLMGQTSNALELVQSGTFQFVANRALPSGGSSVDVTSRPNKVEFKGENAKGDLAFFGQARNVGYSSDGGGIKFDGEMSKKDIKLKEKKKNTQLILSFSVSGETDTYSCYLTVTESGSATLSVNSNNRSSISYNGNVSEISGE